MYVVMKNKELIAAHEDKDIILEYICSQNDPSMEILKIKKRKSRKLEETSSFLDIYLVRYGNFYVPYGQYEAIKDVNGQRDFDLKYCRDILFRLLEEKSVVKEDMPAVMKTISIVISEIESLDDNDYDQLEKLHRLCEELKI